MNKLLTISLIESVSTIRGFHSFHQCLNGFDLLQSIRGDIYKGTPKRNQTDTNQKLRNNQYDKTRGNNKKNHSNKVKSKKFTIRWTTGSDRARLAVNRIIKEVHDMNKDGTIKLVDPSTNQLQVSDIRTFIKGLNLDEQGLSIVNVERIQKSKDRTIQIPLLKRVDAATALKRYAEQLAKDKEKELAELGVLKKKNTSSKKDNTLKHIRITWQISDDDLKNQKANEIVSLLEKGHKVNLYIESKSNTFSKNWLENFEELEENETNRRLSKKEINEYTNLVETLKSLVEPFSISPVIEGSIYSKMIIKLAPKPFIKKNEDKKPLREERKRERQLKLQKRIEKKKLREGENG